MEIKDFQFHIVEYVIDILANHW